MAQKKKETHSKAPLIIAGIAAAGAVAGYFLYGPKGAENRKKVRAWSLKAKGEVLEKVEKAKEMSEERYYQIVDQISEKYAKLKDTEEAEVVALNKELKKYWKDMQKQFAATKKAVKKAAKKSSKK